ncbi:MAG: hypothetical protein KatS3mg022_0089 [Armatimonadota bacterium]|nr:MAG: hypothetical protein KatS3mg022_0089 [Armatimonadota bacterium]
MATYTNPVYARDFPDPHVLFYRGKFYAYATHSSGHDFQVMESPDLVHWTHKGSAFRPPLVARTPVGAGGDSVPWAAVYDLFCP